MRLSNMEFIKLLPSFMRGDAAVHGLSAGVDEAVRALDQVISTFSQWDKIDSMSEAELDAFAQEMGLDWYNKTADITARRTVVKESDLVYQHLGTKWSVENVIKSYFGVGLIREWWKYDGEPGHFRVLTTNPTIQQERFEEFLNLLNKVKRCSAHLDGVFITIENSMPLYHGMALHDTAHETHRIGADIILEEG